jgi:hypothetical protein
MHEIFFNAFVEELTKIAGAPSNIKKMFKKGKVPEPGSYAWHRLLSQEHGTQAGKSYTTGERGQHIRAGRRSAKAAKAIAGGELVNIKGTPFDMASLVSSLV